MTLLEALADERKMLEDEIQADNLEIRSRIDHRAEKIAAKQRIEKEMEFLAGGMD